MLLPLTVSCFSKIQIGFTFLVPAHPGSPGQRAIKCVCVCIYPVIAEPIVHCVVYANERRTGKLTVDLTKVTFAQDVKNNLLCFLLPLYATTSTA